MKKEIRTVVYDDELRIEAYRFEGIVQPFPNHFHEHYVIGFIENGERCLSCKNQEYTIKKGDIVLFNPGDNHACVHSLMEQDEVSKTYSFPKSYVSYLKPRAVGTEQRERARQMMIRRNKARED